MSNETFEQWYEKARDEVFPYPIVKSIAEAAWNACKAAIEGAAEPVAWLPEFSFQRSIDAVVCKAQRYSDDTPLYTRALPPAEQTTITDMVNRFLGWKLPKDFAPDHYISFDRVAAETLYNRTNDTAWPVGTNLLSADQATAMVKYMLAGMMPPAEQEELERLRDVVEHNRVEIHLLNTEFTQLSAEHEILVHRADVDIIVIGSLRAENANKEAGWSAASKTILRLEAELSALRQKVVPEGWVAVPKILAQAAGQKLVLIGQIYDGDKESRRLSVELLAAAQGEQQK